jgi:hypothetical protein
VFREPVLNNSLIGLFVRLVSFFFKPFSFTGKSFLTNNIVDVDLLTKHSDF